MSNVIGFKAFKNTLKRDSGYAPVSGENGYSVIRCVFPVGGDWDDISAVSAGFFVHPKDIAVVTTDITDGEERFALLTIPGALLKQGERLHFGLFATVGGVTIATNTVALDVERGIVSDDIDYDPEEAAGMFEQFSNALNTALLGKANKAAAGSAGELAALDGNGSPIRSGITVAQRVGEGSADKVPTTEAVRNALNDAEDTTAENIDWIFQGNSAYFPQLYFEQYFTANGSNYRLIYDDRDGERHVLFDFAQLPAAKGEKGDAGRGVTSFALNNGVLTANFDDMTSQTIGNVKGADGADGQDGAEGKSAYEIAVENGFVGTERQWLSTLQGEKGDNGRGVTSFSLNNGVLTANFDDRTSQTIGNVKGPQGAPGNDYVLTEQDKADIADIVLQELPTTQGVLYGNTSN